MNTGFEEPEDPTSSSLQQMKRYYFPDLWFSDGDVVLSSRIAEHEVLFCVHRELLCTHSAVWRLHLDNLRHSESCTEPCREEEGPKSICVVALSEEGDQWLYFLRALYYRGSGSLPQRRFFHDMKAMPNHRIEVASSVAVLAHKYEVQWLYNQAVRILGGYYTHSLEELDANVRWHACRSPSESLVESIRLVQHALSEAAVFLINAAREAKTPELLRLVPHALYAASLLDTKSLGMGTMRGRPLPRAMFLGREYLHPEDRRLCALARLWRLCRKEGTPPESFNAGAGAEVTIACCEAQGRLQQLMASQDCVLTRMDPLARSVEHWIDELRRSDSDVEKGIICEACMARIKSHHNEARKKVWDDWQRLFKDWPAQVTSPRYTLSGAF